MTRSKTGPKPRPVIDRLMEKVEWRDGCLIFTGTTNNQGLGKTHGKLWDGKRVANVHRLMWIHHNGEIPPGLCVLHTCDNPPCVNIDHLFLGTIKDNNEDMVAKDRHWNSKKTHCPHRHEYNEANTYIKPSDGGRQCRVCEQNRKRTH